MVLIMYRNVKFLTNLMFFFQFDRTTEKINNFQIIKLLLLQSTKKFNFLIERYEKIFILFKIPEEDILI